ncbi:sulfur carrier protein ThiS [Fluviispira multicolorata]|uniref:Sulfur carrier protein ThiS n=1 Tax=Fluviispira multicolorata TaxID=2654512 RepID=A0A833N373_9BACT|nr:sulfur carrier protein ThiS [Fluviispira multicolorata]KAB8029684.1 sulfur carrier protein ThiS [Fluviispira multicolorata]
MAEIILKINGNEKSFNIEKLSIQMLLEKEFINSKGIALALNKVFIPKQKYSELFLQNKDEIEIVTPFQGG